MVFRPLGTYLLTSSALYAQTQTNYHLNEMAKYAAESTSLTTIAGSEISTSIELESKSALDSESGLEMQSEAIALQEDAEREFVMAEEENAMAVELSEEAEILHEQSAEEALESQSAFLEAGELELRSQELQIQAEKDRAAGVSDEEKAMAFFDKAANAEEIAQGAEEKAGEYEAIAARKGAASVKDAETLAETETEALEDAEAVATCTAIPFLNVICDAFGAITEAGLQTVAAYEGAKAAIESISAASAQGKERAEIALAVEKHEEAASAASKAEEFQSLASEENTKANAEVGEREVALGAKDDAEMEGTELKEDSERKEVMAKEDDAKAAEFYAKAAGDESKAVGEEAKGISSQIESDELLSQSTEEEFESQSERVDAESKESEAERLLKQSIGHGIYAVCMVVQSLMTAFLVVYIVLMRGVTKFLLPNIVHACNGEQKITVKETGESLSRSMLHFGMIFGTMQTLSDEIMHFSFEDATIRDRLVAMAYLSLAAAMIETIFLHCVSSILFSLKLGENAKATTIAAFSTFLSNVFHLSPIVLMECLILLTIFGPGIFDFSCQSSRCLIWSWCTLLFLIPIHIWFFKLQAIPTPPSQTSNDDWIESYFCQVRKNIDQETSLIARRTSFEYGSIEEMTVLVASEEKDDASELTSPSSKILKHHDHSRPSDGCFETIQKSLRQYFKELQFTTDLLVLSMMVMLLWRCTPVAKALHSVAYSTLGIVSHWLSAPALTAALVALIVVVHYLFVR